MECWKKNNENEAGTLSAESLSPNQVEETQIWFWEQANLRETEFEDGPEKVRA